MLIETEEVVSVISVVSNTIRGDSNGRWVQSMIAIHSQNSSVIIQIEDTE